MQIVTVSRLRFILQEILRIQNLRLMERCAFSAIDVQPMEFEWNVFPGFTTLQLVDKSPSS